MKRLTVRGRPDWRRILDGQRWTWHGDGDNGCWRENAAWLLAPAEVDSLKHGARSVFKLHEEAAAHVRRQHLWDRLGFSQAESQAISVSMERGDPGMLGRFDFLIDGDGQPRLLEFNADNALSLVETAVWQRDWREAVMPEVDQFNTLHASLVAAWRASGCRRVHCAWRPMHPEVEGTVRYMASVVREAGLDAEMTALHCIGWHRKRNVFVDASGGEIECCWKLYPWEWMLREPFAHHLAAARCRFVEPVWRLLMGNKGMLALLWELFPDHPCLLPCAGELPDDWNSWVAKPVLGREGGNVTVCRDGKIVDQTEGEFSGQRLVYQKFVDAPSFEGLVPQFGVWMVGSEPVAIGIRETDGLIVTGDSPFVPHVVEMSQVRLAP